MMCQDVNVEGLEAYSLQGPTLHRTRARKLLELVDVHHIIPLPE